MVFITEPWVVVLYGVLQLSLVVSLKEFGSSIYIGVAGFYVHLVSEKGSKRGQAAVEEGSMS